ncbi:MAG: site-specific integrase [Flavobacterium nitrogenifigens]|uniref:site-specific integrase n=1 Tax=Flavobacterium nitrogenifigens TaxID=1617283 RepID=UPI0028094619|nr:site-specific integrase [Flavobacterium nitrogenifigens]MDQ8011397.1 site-specific integrase [Flavobacterium nitrogenifigens]
MTTKNLSILFVQAKNRVNKRNQSPLYCRITLDGRRKQFSTGINIEIEFWNSRKQIVNKSHKSAVLFNSLLQNIESEINKTYAILKLENHIFDIDDLYNKYIGVEIKKKEYFCTYYNRFLSKIQKLIGLEIKQSTYNKFYYVSKHLEAFIKWKYKKSDFLLEDLNLQFLNDFEYYLKTIKLQKQITINKTIQRLRTPIKQAISEGYIDRDPFILFKSKRVIKEVIFLSSKELKAFESAIFKPQRLKRVQDLFIFCCYTGLAFNEMANLETNDIQIGFDGTNWINLKREKTQRQLHIPILPKAQKIIDKYHSIDSKVLPSITNQKFNSYLKEITEILEIEKRVTHHTARKTFASTVLLYNDVPMEIVSELLGHSNMIITQEHYGKIVQKRVSEEMNKLKIKLK